MIVAGIIPQFLNKELWMLYIASAFAGFGMAYVNVLSSALISDHFKGVEKGKIMGFQSSALSLVGALMTTMSGSMADLFGWKYSYLVSLLTLPMLILVLALLPKDNVPEKTNGQQNVKLSGRVYYWGFLGLLTSIFINVFNTNIAMLIDESGLGGATISGTVTSVYMLIGIPAGLLLGWVVKKLKQNVVGIMCAIMAVGFFVIAFAQNLPLIYFGTFLFGIGFAIRSPAAITFMAYMVPSAASAIAIAILQACSQVGNFLSPLLVNWISEIAGGDTQTKFIISGIALIIIAAIYMFANPVKQHEIENN
jgi:MFS family permease